MLVVMPFCHGDLADERQLLLWIEKLGQLKAHDCLLVTQANTPWNEVTEMREIARRVFKYVWTCTNKEPADGWPRAFNSLWEAAARHVKSKGLGHWLWLEPDAIPLKTGWLDEIDAAYRSCGKRFMGQITKRMYHDATLPEQHLAGTAVYDCHAIDMLGPFCERQGAMDITSAGVAVPHAANTPLIYHFWGRKNQPPVFVDKRGPNDPVNHVPLSFIRPGAVIFHRSKGGTLISLLRRKMFPGSEPNREFTVVLPFCNKDYHLMLKNVEWMRDLRPNSRFDCVISVDRGTLRSYVQNVRAHAERVFGAVSEFYYPDPPRQTWPQAANWAFQHTARQMHALGKPWLWCESDATPLTDDWIDVLQQRYVRCGLPLMGPIVKNMGHMNGVGVYPFDFPVIAPKAMAEPDTAFDVAMREETSRLTHDAGDLICHSWCIMNGKSVPYGTGPVASFKKQSDLLRWIPPGSVLFHRCKDGTLIDRLREKRKHA